MNVHDSYLSPHPGCVECGEELVRGWLRWLGEEPGRDGLLDTPGRVVRLYRDLPDASVDHRLTTAFESVAVDQLVIVRDVEVWSLCEHHLLPFKLTMALGYITREKVLGLSKFVRLARLHAGRLQLQERLVEELADAIEDATASPDVAVLASGVHLCLAMRGVREQAATLVTSALRGAFRNEPSARAEFMSLAKGS